MLELHQHRNPDTLAQVLTEHLAGLAGSAIRRRGEATLVLAGGTTPVPAYRRLAQHDLDWSRMNILPGDERWVPHSHPACNLSSLRNAIDQPARYLPLTPVAPQQEPDLTTAQHSLRSIRGRPDVCLLGMGSDGHFASLFPGAPGLQQALDPAGKEAVAVIHPGTLPLEAPFARISLTLSAILECRMLILALRGNDKREVLEQAAEHDEASRYPVAALLQHAGARLDIHWSP
ncbi:6-phosphogluconolactonase [Wenzhouxiangella sp. AB-CW3]|uniref:6-phosphogluconolactonase n=1 Tax=Wenzhouxiangella sp. AB-CW3 TaxID=2771012 RepID=UPI00168B9146|nr:6-phosphogluconolactonase [Wenzhouxiangella sp. AB-CW3]QOC21767.1 6-phosphogluconolactonase [Wenzhouxiangella sp. AB-CW3]